jgi:cytochrome oxidase Cu insertion factor (SCO1/SenC/PrrC family)
MAGVTTLAVLVVAVLLVRSQVGSSRDATGSLVRQALKETAEAPHITLATGELLNLDVIPGAGRKAPDFTLTDQSGHPVSLSQFHGRSVVLTFNDDKCTDLCPLLAQDILAANRDLGPAARHVVWMSVNANPFYPKVSAVKAWTDEHGLGRQPNWYFSTARPSRLEAVWQAYGIEVLLNRKARSVEHGTEMFFIDPSGRERAIANFGTADSDTALFAHGMAQMANDLLPPAEQNPHVGGPSVRGPATVGASAVSFTLPYLANGHGQFSLASLRGHYVVVNFWSSTCPACKTELPALEAAYRRAARKVAFVGVDVSDQDGPARALAAKDGLTYPLVKDSRGTAAAAEKVTGLPFTVVLSPKGQVIVRHPGALTTEELLYVLKNQVPGLAGS